LGQTAKAATILGYMGNIIRVLILPSIVFIKVTLL
jgi:hypothetical protein